MSAISSGAPVVAASGLWGSARALAVAALSRHTGRPVLLVTSGPTALHRSAADVRFFLSTLEPAGTDASPGVADPVLELPAAAPTGWRGSRHREPEAERALVCHHLLAGDAVVVVATPAAIESPFPAPDDLRARSFTIAYADTWARETLVGRLEAASYQRVEAVVEVGQWSLRGGIVDIFSPAMARPVRVEFFGDEVESLRPFDRRPSGRREGSTRSR